MADKPTTPEAPGGRRPKREAPTIDLKATEIPPPQETAAEPPREAPAPPPPVHESPVQEPPAQKPPVQDPPAREPPAQEPPPETPPPSPPPARIASHGAMLIAGFAGAAIMSAVLGALWYGGALPARQTSVPDTKAVDALGERVSRIENEITKLPAGDKSVAERLSAADSAMKSLGVALAALNHRGDGIAADASQARQSAEAAQKAVSDLRAGMQDAAKNAPGGVAPEALEALRQRVAALEQSVKDSRGAIAEAAAKAEATSKAVRLALGAAALRAAVENGSPYAEALAQMKALGAEPASLAPLEPFAQSGVPSKAALVQELNDLLPALRQSSGAQGAASGGFFERLQANAGRLVRIRPVDAPSGDAPADALARIEAEAAKADIDGALADLAMLPEAARKPAQAWIAKARQRQAALAAVRQFAGASAHTLGKSPSADALKQQ